MQDGDGRSRAREGTPSEQDSSATASYDPARQPRAARFACVGLGCILASYFVLLPVREDAILGYGTERRVTRRGPRAHHIQQAFIFVMVARTRATDRYTPPDGCGVTWSAGCQPCSWCPWWPRCASRPSARFSHLSNPSVADIRPSHMPSLQLSWVRSTCGELPCSTLDQQYMHALSPYMCVPWPCLTGLYALISMTAQPPLAPKSDKPGAGIPLTLAAILFVTGEPMQRLWGELLVSAGQALVHACLAFFVVCSTQCRSSILSPPLPSGL